MPEVRPDVIANRVFVGCPWYRVRAKYEGTIAELNKRYPLSFVIVGRMGDQEARDLLQVIKDTILSSSVAVFDATGGNPNVSLEYGFAEAWDVPKALYVSSHAASTKASKDAPIIADLAGKTRNQYTTESALQKRLAEMATKHPYSRKFERFLQDSFGQASKGQKKRARALALKIIHALDERGSRRRADIVQDLLADQVRYKKDEIDSMIQRLHRAELVESTQGRYSTVTIFG